MWTRKDKESHVQQRQVDLWTKLGKEWFPSNCPLLVYSRHRIYYSGTSQLCRLVSGGRYSRGSYPFPSCFTVTIHFTCSLFLNVVFVYPHFFATPQNQSTAWESTLYIKPIYSSLDNYKQDMSILSQRADGILYCQALVCLKNRPASFTHLRECHWLLFRGR